MKIRFLSICFLVAYSLLSQPAIDSAQIYRQTFLSPITHEDSLRAEKELGRSIDDLLRNKYLRNAKYSIAVYSLDQKKFLYKNNIDAHLTPASNTKLFTTFTALHQLSKNYFLTTEVFTDGKLNDSVIHGNLYIVGRGDPLLTINDMDYLAEEIYNLGIRKVNGNIYADDTFFDNVWERIDYSNDKDKVINTPPITCLSIEKNTATVLIKAGSGRGNYVDVQLIPNSETFSKSISAKVASNDIAPDNNSNMEGAYFGDELYALASGRRRSTVRVSSKYNEKTEKQLFTITGYLNRNRTTSYRFFIIDPPLAVAGSLKDRLISTGIQVIGSVSRGNIDTVDKSKRMFLAENGRNIMEMIKIINKESDNYLAENLFKLIGASAGGKDSTAEFSKRVTKIMMKDLEIPFEGCKLNDGSGLSRRNLLSAGAIINLLIRINDLGYYNDFASTLSVAGIDGTLKKRMRGTFAQDNLRAKTGTLRNASALSGYVYSLDGERIAFAIIFNGNSVSAYKDIENKIGILLSQFFYYNVSN